MTNRIPIALAAVAALAMPVATADTYIMQLLNIAMLNAIVVLGLNFATGWTGQINFGQAAFYGLGAYATAIAAKAGLPWIVTPVLSVALVLAASLVLGLPTLRLRTYYLAMTTIGFGEIVRLAGCLYASSIRFVSPDSFSGVKAVLLMTMLIVGGMGSIPGCIIGATALTLLPEALRSLGQWYLVLYGLGVIVVIVLLPGGLASMAATFPFRRLRTR